MTPSGRSPRRARLARRTRWLIEQRRVAPAEGALAVRKAELEGELASERRQARAARAANASSAPRGSSACVPNTQLDCDVAPLAERLAQALADAAEGVEQRVAALEAELASERLLGEQMTAQLRACAAREAEIQATLRAAGETRHRG